MAFKAVAYVLLCRSSPHPVPTRAACVQASPAVSRMLLAAVLCVAALHRGASARQPDSAAPRLLPSTHMQALYGHDRRLTGAATVRAHRRALLDAPAEADAADSGADDEDSADGEDSGAADQGGDASEQDDGADAEQGAPSGRARAPLSRALCLETAHAIYRKPHAGRSEAQHGNVYTLARL